MTQSTKNIFLDHSEVITTIIVGLSSVFIAYASYSSSLLGSAATKNYAKSTTLTVEANTTYLEASRNYETATDEESATEQARYEEEITLADEHMEEAERVDTLSDKYLLYTVLFGTLMFFASLPSVIKSTGPRTVILMLSCLGFAILLIGIFLLPTV